MTLCRHARTQTDPYMLGKWGEAKKKLLVEVDLVKDLQRELQTISNGPKGVSANAHASMRWTHPNGKVRLYSFYLSWLDAGI